MRRRVTNNQKQNAIDLQELGATLLIYGEIDDPTMRHFNPAIAWHNNKLKIAIRSCNFMVERGGKWSFRDGAAYSRTDVLLGDLDPDTMQVSGVKTLKLSQDSPIQILTAGLEDVRLFSRKDGLHAIGFQSDRITKSLHNESTSMAEYLIKGDTMQYLKTYPKPDPKVVEKNWMPTDTPSDLFDLTYSDSQVYKDGKLIGKPTTTQIHGGTVLLKQKDGTYLSLVHEKIVDFQYSNPYNRGAHKVYDKYVYYHYLARHGKDGIITQLSKQFRFGTLENIEFAAGMVEYKDSFLITFGIRDCKWAVCRIHVDKLLSLFTSE